MAFWGSRNGDQTQESTMPTLHEDSLVIDGLIISKWSREVFEAMRKAGISAANCTCSIWEDFPTTMKAVADWKKMLRENDDLLTQVYNSSDVERAKREGKTGIILGWQNATGFGDYLPLVQVYHELGLRVVQLTYNTATAVGSGCYEKHDGGLTDFGRELVNELNRVGILIDLSHVGHKTANDTVRASHVPVVYSHCLPLGLKEHPRNKSDEALRFIVSKGGLVGVTMFPPFLAKGSDATIDDYVDAIEYVMNLIGEDSVAIGTDFTQGYGPDFFRYLTKDKGHARSLATFGEIRMPTGFARIEDFPNLTVTLERRRWSESRIRKVLGLNWLRVLKEVWRN
jgi:membrane dipeptidase